MKLLFVLGMPEIIAIAVLVLLLFGGKKIPELMRGLGRGVKEFKDGMKDIADKPDNEAADSISEKPVKESLAQDSVKEDNAGGGQV